MSNNNRRGPWSAQEDKYLMDCVQSQGALNWVKIATLLQTRTPKQCRERYHQNLKPSLNHEPISPEEGAFIEKQVAEIGKRWAEIARRLHNRSDNAVKNWWNGSQNRRKRLNRRQKHTAFDGLHDVPHHTYAQRIPERLRLPAAAQFTSVGYGALSPTSPHYPPYSASGWPSHSGLPSPSTTTSPTTDPLMELPSLTPDTGSHYSTSPTSARPASPVQLPPLGNHIGGCELPPLRAVTYTTSPSQLPTAPNSPDTSSLLPRAPMMPVRAITAPNSPDTAALHHRSPTVIPVRTQETVRDPRLRMDNLVHSPVLT